MLEFGCNTGSSAIVLATLGAEVHGVDISAELIEVTRLNAERYGLADRIHAHHVPDTRHLPFPDGHFDIVSCVSVLEYVPEEILDAVMKEMDRVLKVGGVMHVGGTSNRLLPRENHSRRWFIHYLPRWVTGNARIERGVAPWRVRFGFGPHYLNVDRLDGGKAYLTARAAMGSKGWKMSAFRAINALVQAVGLTPGYFTPSLSMTLRKLPTSSAP